MPTPNRKQTTRSSRRPLLLIAAAVGGLGLTAAACSSSAASNAGAYGQPARTVPASGAAAISTHSTSLGTILTGPGGRSVYLFEKDHGTSSACAGACASLWPPVTTTKPPTANGTAQQKLLGTTRRSDGATQVTYAGHPLYYFAGDHAVGDVTGEGLNDFGAGWYVLATSGAKIDKD